jgi:hypothetical protein
MSRRILIGIAFGSLLALPLHAQDSQPSLGDVARQARKAKEERDKSAVPQKNVFTDDNFSSGGAAGKADLARLDNPQTPSSDRLNAARAVLDRAARALDMLEPMDRPTLAKLALQGSDADFAGRRAWEDKLFAAKEHYVSHGRDLCRQTKAVLNEMESLTSGGKVPASDPRAQELGHKARMLMQDAYQTEADFQAIILEGQNLAKQGASH